MFKFLNFPTCFNTYSLEDSVTEITMFCLFFLIYSQSPSLKYMHTSAHTHIQIVWRLTCIVILCRVFHRNHWKWEA